MLERPLTSGGDVILIHCHLERTALRFEPAPQCCIDSRSQTASPYRQHGATRVSTAELSIPLLGVDSRKSREFRERMEEAATIWQNERKKQTSRDPILTSISHRVSIEARVSVSECVRSLSQQLNEEMNERTYQTSWHGTKNSRKSAAMYRKYITSQQQQQQQRQQQHVRQLASQTNKWERATERANEPATDANEIL